MHSRVELFGSYRQHGPRVPAPAYRDPGALDCLRAFASAASPAIGQDSNMWHVPQKFWNNLPLFMSHVIHFLFLSKAFRDFGKLCFPLDSSRRRLSSFSIDRS